MERISRKKHYISGQAEPGSFAVIHKGKVNPIVLSKEEFSGVLRVARHLQEDLESISGSRPEILLGEVPSNGTPIIAGTLGQSDLLASMEDAGAVDFSFIRGKWDSFCITVVEKPLPGLDQALVIAGSNKRGTIYGLYDLSERMGVSPWHWWADVPVQRQENLFVKAGKHESGEPSVKFRGFFINDEYPCLAPHAIEKFGGLNHDFYEKVFELILRLKGNYFWPAMWNEAFHDDDPLNTEIADELGIIMGTSHHEPLMRAWKEWQRYGEGDWNLETNRDFITKYWKESVRRQGNREAIMTIGMRGDGDEPLTEESREELLLDILETQRNILEEVTGRKAEEIPQLWAVYKEVYEYYEKGVPVPDDVIIMLCDDNWGNLVKLPGEEDKKRSGGHALYYHFDYVGGPRNYKWLNSSPLPRVWEQLHLALKGGIDRLWMVNVGDIKPLEFPLSFYMDYAWNAEEWDADQLQEYTNLWAAQQFGPQFSEEIGEILTCYSFFSGRRKPELIDAETYSLIHYQEAEKVVEDYQALARRTLELKEKIPAAFRDSYYQLVEYPVLALANLNDLHVSTALNRLYARQGRAATRAMADRVKKLFAKDKKMRDYYNNELAGGKWHHMMDQNHISYTYWQQPDEDVLPRLEDVTLADSAEMGVALEGSESWWPQSSEGATLPEFTPWDEQGHYLEIFNRGKEPFAYTVESSQTWIKVDRPKGEVGEQERIWLEIDWDQAPEGRNVENLTIHGAGQSVNVAIPLNHYPHDRNRQESIFMESDGCVSIEAEHYSAKKEQPGMEWRILPGHGRTLSAVSAFPISLSVENPGAESPHLEYRCELAGEGEVELCCTFSPTNNLRSGSGLCYAVSIDDEALQIVNLHSGEVESASGNYQTDPFGWDQAVGDNCRIVRTRHMVKGSGVHRIRYYLMDSALVLQKLVLWTGKEKVSYLGPPESPSHPKR